MLHRKPQWIDVQQLFSSRGSMDRFEYCNINCYILVEDQNEGHPLPPTMKMQNWSLGGRGHALLLATCTTSTNNYLSHNDEAYPSYPRAPSETMILLQPSCIMNMQPPLILGTVHPHLPIMPKYKYNILFIIRTHLDNFNHIPLQCHKSVWAERCVQH